MQTEQEALKNLTLTMERYRKNKENVSPELLQTKYRESFQRLKDQLKKETETYITIVMLQGMFLHDDYIDETLDALDKSVKENEIGKRAGKAVFKNYDLEELRQIALEQRDRNLGIVLSWRGGLRLIDI